MSWLLKTVGILVYLVCSTLGCRPLFRMYESEGYGEDYIENVREYVALGDEPDLTLKGITGSRTHTCPHGLWMGYQYDRFQGSTTFYSEKDGSVLNCKLQSGPDYYKSLKVVGDPEDFTASGVVTFLNRYNEWGEATYLEDTPELRNPGVGSMIITGSVEVEIFTESNFQGESVCIGPNNGRFYYSREFQERNAWRNGTELYTNMGDMETILGMTEFNSLRFGCGERSKKNYKK